MHLLERVPDVEDVKSPVRPRSGHVVSASIHRDSSHRAFVRQHLHRRLRQVRRPECDGAVAVADVHYRVSAVLGHGRGRAETGAELLDELAGRGVLLFEVPGETDGGEEEVVGEILHVRDFDMFAETVNFDALRVVDVDVFLLRGGEELVVVQPPVPCQPSSSFISPLRPCARGVGNRRT